MDTRVVGAEAEVLMNFVEVTARKQASADGEDSGCCPHCSRGLGGSCTHDHEDPRSGERTTVQTHTFN